MLGGKTEAFDFGRYAGRKWCVETKYFKIGLFVYLFSCEMIFSHFHTRIFVILYSKQWPNIYVLRRRKILDDPRCI
jgi:hypothetical protein